MASLTPSPGNWNIFGFNLPDFGITEKVISPEFGNTAKTPTTGESAPLRYDNPTNEALQKDIQQKPTIGPTNYPNLTKEVQNQPKQEVTDTLPDWGTGQFGGQEVGSGGSIWKWDANLKKWTRVGQDTSGQRQNSTKLSNSQLDELVTINGERKTRRSAIQEGLMDEFGNVSQRPQYTGPSEEDLRSAYQPLLDVLSQAEQQLGTSYGQQKQNIESQTENAKKLADEQKRIAEQTISQNDLLGARRRDDVITAARKLFQELQMANQQRFGGASSAGQAASELQGREFMGISGKARQGYADLVSELNNKSLEVNNNYSLALQQLEDKKTTALTQAQNDFQNALLQISQQKAGIESEKAQRRLAALEQYRQEVNAINQQQNQFAQQLQMMKAQSDMALDNYAKQLAMSKEGAGQSLQSYVSNPQLSAVMSPTTQNQVATTYTGPFNQVNPQLLQQLQGMTAGTTKRDDLTNLYGGLSNIQSMAR